MDGYTFAFIECEGIARTQTELTMGVNFVMHSTTPFILAKWTV